MSVSCECCVGSGLCDGPITRPEDRHRGGIGRLGLSSHKRKKTV